jgi:lipoate-protein ligase A
VVAFGPKDRLEAGYADAVEAARSHGFGALDRLAGGRAAVFHGETIAFAWCIPEPSPRLTITDRFESLASIMAAAFRSLGVDARVGEVPGEYCPGGFSVNARGRTKLVGIGQRLIAGGAHRGAVIVVGGSERIREVLVPVYAALGLDWDPETAGSVEDEVGETALEAVEGTILAQLGERYELRDSRLDAATLDLAARFESEHRARPA